jgi:amino acid adenylation domain-containing protein
MPPSNLSAAIAAAGRAHPHRAALWAKGTLVTYDELLDRSSRIAAALLDAGVRPGDRVAILGERSLDPYVGILAALRAGCVYVPLNPRFPLERNRAMVEAAAASALIIDRPSASRFEALLASPPEGLRVVVAADGVDAARALAVVRPEALRAPEPGRAWPTRAPDDDCYLLFTSGSTGTPKGVPISHGNVLAYLAGISEITPVRADDRLVQLVDLTFDLSGHDMYLAWTNGAALYSVPEHGTLFATRYVADHDLTGWLSVPSAVGLARREGLLDDGSLPSLRFSHFCGEALPGPIAEAWAAAAPRSEIYNLYGPTEATIAFSWYRYERGQAEPPTVVPIGRPLRDQRMRIVDDEDRVCAPGATGELLLAGSQLTRGYWRAPEIDAQKFVVLDGIRWYRTGDLARRTADDVFDYAGRIDQQTKILGFRVELLEIEGALRRVSGRDLVAVIAWPVTPDGGAEGTIAFVVGAPIDEDAVTARLGEVLPPYMVPRRFVYVDALPLNPNGKTDYRALARHPDLVPSDA